MPKKVTLYLDDELAQVIEDLRRIHPVIPPLSKSIIGLITDGLPTESRLYLQRARRTKREDLSDD